MSILIRLPSIGAAVACFFIFASGLRAGDAVPAAKEIKVKGLLGRGVFGKRGSVYKPTIIDNAKQLAEAVKNEQTQAAITGQVDFAKQKLIFFRWAGSGQDGVSFSIEKNDAGKPSVVFRYRRGRTRDLRPHAKLFAVSRAVNCITPKKVKRKKR